MITIYCLLIKRIKQATKKLAPAITWHPCKPVNIKKEQEYTLSEKLKTVS